MSEQLALLPGYLTGHLQLTMLALLVSTLLSVPLGVLATRVRWLEQPALAIAGLIQTIPSLALLAVMVPILAALSLQSIGFLPAIVGLTLYGVLPVLRNTVTGIRSVDLALIEAARGVGMTDMQQLRHVELPLAMPVIVAGIRTATVWIVGIATLSTPVGATSLGNYIFSGLQTRNFTAVLVGSVAAAMLALLLDGLVHSLERGIQTRRRPRVALALGVFIVLYGYTAATLASQWIGRRQRPVVVGAKTFTEQYITSALLAQLVERETGSANRAHPVARLDGGIRRATNRRHRPLCRLLRDAVDDDPQTYRRAEPVGSARGGRRLPRARARSFTGGPTRFRKRLCPGGSFRRRRPTRPRGH